MTRNEVRPVVDIETGELFEKAIIVDNPENYILIHKDSEANRKEFLKNRVVKSQFDELAGGFSFTMLDTLKELIADEDFTQSDKTRIMFLGTFVSYEKNNRYLTYGNGRPILKNQLMDLLEMTNRKEFYNLYNTMLEKGVFTEDRESRSVIKIIWSKKYHFKGAVSGGSKTSEKLVKSYDKQIRELYRARNSKGKPIHTAHSLFTFFSLLPYVHPESNALCRHPEKPVSQSQPFTIRELADIYGIERVTNFRRLLFRIKIHKMPVVALAQTTEDSRIYINPFVVNRTGKKPNATLFTLFESSFQRLADRQGWSEEQRQQFLKQ
ncbi:hypothetical protein [Saccharococcus sp. Marseille-Q5394]|uniref:hypothetical protein n=1 Tax=Saccharococcus sp. Marseille-Q5394 TaxID=2972778 RepID=UPI0021CAE24D|nr:hypothetical protein [Saccharococcus sp. Marseille-Q5394]